MQMLHDKYILYIRHADLLPSAIQQGTTTVLIIKSVGWENTTV